MFNSGGLDRMMAQIRVMGLTTVPEKRYTSKIQGPGGETAFVKPDGTLVVLYEFARTDPHNRF